MNLNLVNATDIHKAFFWKHYYDSMQAHIEQIWGWDEEWQKFDFETRWLECENKLIRNNDIDIGYIQTKDLANEHYIMMLILLPHYRSRGYGQQVIKHIKANATLRDISLRVFKTNTKALNFYQVQGFNNVIDEGNFYLLKQKVS